MSCFDGKVQVATGIVLSIYRILFVLRELSEDGLSLSKSKTLPLSHPVSTSACRVCVSHEHVIMKVLSRSVELSTRHI